MIQCIEILNEFYRDFLQQTNSSYQSQTRAESAQILSQKYSIREKVKQEMLAKERQKRVVRQRRKQAKVSKWQSKTKRSPFMVDLVAENERIDEVGNGFVFPNRTTHTRVF